MTYLDRQDGTRIWYQKVGPAGGDPALPVVLSHGFGATAEMWLGNVAALAASREVVTWDLRGHGKTQCPPDQDLYSAAACVEDLAALLDEVGADQAVLGGLSLGGYLSLAFYLAHPERVAGLMLADTGPGFRNDEARQNWNERAYAQADRLVKAGDEASASLALAARGILAQADASVIDSLPQVDVPTLVVVGAEDSAFLGAASYMTAKIAGAVQVTLDGAGHMANIDARDAFNSEVLNFLEGLP
ncbi:MAG TPA: alpha/beta hydrolase [Streptosporangiaceae bacterium]|nr:alpha/beta hydrolase [Streptosporangiaceae bacterium]